MTFQLHCKVGANKGNGSVSRNVSGRMEYTGLTIHSGLTRVYRIDSNIKFEMSHGMLKLAVRSAGSIGSASFVST